MLKKPLLALLVVVITVYIAIVGVAYAEDLTGPTINITVVDKDLTWMTFNWYASDPNNANITEIWLVRNQTNVTIFNETNPSYNEKTFSTLHNTEYYTLFVNATDDYNNTAVKNLTAMTEAKGNAKRSMSYIWILPLLLGLIIAFEHKRRETE